MRRVIVGIAVVTPAALLIALQTDYIDLYRVHRLDCGMDGRLSLLICAGPATFTVMLRDAVVLPVEWEAVMV